MLTADEARQLDRLGLATPIGALAATASGLHRARARGYGLEFHDYRAYQPGDELRSIDWTVDAGFSIRALREPKPTEEAIRKQPDLEDATRVPYFLIFDLTVPAAASAR